MDEVSTDITPIHSLRLDNDDDKEEEEEERNIESTPYITAQDPQSE